MSRLVQVALIWALVFYNSSAVDVHYCPSTHCLMQAGADTFTCEQYIDSGHQCAIESGTCACADGEVKYGYIGVWSEEQNFTSGSTLCANSVFTDPASNKFKVCWCTPHTPSSTVRNSVPAQKHATGTTVAGFAEASCMVAQVSVVVTGWETMGLSAGEFEVIVGAIVPLTVKQAFSASSDVRTISFDAATSISLVRIPKYDLVTLAALRADPAPLKTAGDQISANVPENTVKTAGPLAAWSIPAFPTTTAAPTTAAATTAAAAATTAAAPAVNSTTAAAAPAVNSTTAAVEQANSTAMAAPGILIFLVIMIRMFMEPHRYF